MGSLTSRRGKGNTFVLVDPVELIPELRYINTDYAVASALANSIEAGITDVVVTYDIACQWGKNFQYRLSAYPSIPPLDLTALNSFPLGARGPGNQQKHVEYIAGSG